MTINKINRETFLPTTALGATPIYAEKHNIVVDKVNDISTEAGVGKFDTISEHTSGSGVTVDGVLLKDGTITTTAPTIISVSPAVTAHAGGGKASATALTEELNVITTCATALDSVLLPAAVVGQTIVIANLGAATCAVYAAGTNTIDDIITANYVVIQVEDVVTFHCYTTAKWQSDFESDGVYTTLYTDIIAENTSASGVTIDGVLLKDSGVDAGASGTAGTVDVFPSTASRGKIAITAVDNTGDTTLTITNVAQSGAASFTIPNSGAGYFGVSTAALSLAEMDVLDGVSAGTQAAGKAVIANAQVNTGISKVTQLHIGTSGSETQVTATGTKLNYCDVTTIGTAEASKALVVDASKDIDSINDISCAGLTSSDLTATTVVLSGGSKQLESSGVTPTELSYLDLTTGAGTAEASKALVLDGSLDIVSINDISCASVTSSDLTATTVVLSSAAKKLESSGVTPTELSYLDLTTGAGTAEASKAVVLDASSDVTGINDISLAGLTSSDLSATTVVLSSAAQKLESSGVTPTELNYLDLTTGAGTAEASKAVVLDASSDVTGINDISLAGLTSSDLNATTVVLSSAAKKFESSGVTPTELNFLDDASTANSSASKAAILDSNKELRTNANIGVAGTNCTVVEIGDGKYHVTTLTLTDVVIGTPNAGGNSGHGSLIYTFPGGVHLHSHTWFDVGLTVGSVTTDQPDIGVGSVVGSGAIATLNGTTMEDYVTGITWATALDGSAYTQDTTAATAGVFSGISNNSSGNAKTVYFNAADGWNAGVTGNLTATGTVVLIWTDIA